MGPFGHPGFEPLEARCIRGHSKGGAPRYLRRQQARELNGALVQRSRDSARPPERIVLFERPSEGFELVHVEVGVVLRQQRPTSRQRFMTIALVDRDQEQAQIA